MKKIHCVLLISLLLGGNACKKSFLELTPQTTITTENFFKTASDFNLATQGIYDVLQNRFYQYSSWGLMEMITDNMTTNGIGGAGFVGDFYQIDEYRVLTGNNHLQNHWVTSYQGINRANTVIGRIENAQFSQALKDQYASEAKFIRAYFYFNLVRLFGDVPLVTKELSVNEVLKTTRAPLQDVYNLIVSDLTDAEGKLPISYTGNDIGRATRWAAKALLGKVYLTQKKYTEAAAKLREVVASTRFSLLLNFADVYRSNNANHAESIFEIQYKAGLGGSDREGSAFVDAMAPSNYRTNQLYTGAANANGDGMGIVTKELFDSYAPTDRRRDVSIGVMGTGAAATYFQKKYSTPTTIRYDAEDNFPVLRYADVLLMLAEALNETGYGSAEAFTSINAVRTRAGLTVLTATTTPNQQAFRDALLNERRWELMFENQRWFDLLRFGVAVPLLKSKGYTTIQDHMILYPIPERERLLANLPQNSGY